MGVSHLQLVLVISGKTWQICVKISFCGSLTMLFFLYGVKDGFIWKGENMCLLQPIV